MLYLYKGRSVKYDWVMSSFLSSPERKHEHNSLQQCTTLWTAPLLSARLRSICSLLTSPARLGRPPTEEATELTELMEELLGLWAREETPMATRLLFLALAGLVEGKPMRITLWIGANSPNLGRHWKYLQGGKDNGRKEISEFTT